MYHCESCDQAFEEPIQYEYDYCRYAPSSPCCHDEFVIKDKDGVIVWRSYE